MLTSPKGRYDERDEEMATRHRKVPLPEDLCKEQMIKVELGSLC